MKLITNSDVTATVLTKILGRVNWSVGIEWRKCQLSRI